MTTPEGYIRQISSIEDALKRHNQQVKELRQKQRLAKTRLYEWMSAKGLEEYQGYTIKKVAPRPKIIRKKAKEKKEDALRLFSEIGVNDPEEFWDALQRTQKAGKLEEDE